VKNTICAFEDQKKDATCKKLNDPITEMHMNGCRVLSTNWKLRNANGITKATENISNRLDDGDWDGEWRCAECKPGYFQKSVANEYCAPLLTAGINADHITSELLTPENKKSLEECLTHKEKRGNIAKTKYECFKLGLTKDEQAKHNHLRKHLDRFFGAYQHMQAEYDMIKENPGKTYYCKRDPPDDECFMFWNGYEFGYNCRWTKDEGHVCSRLETKFEPDMGANTDEKPQKNGLCKKFTHNLWDSTWTKPAQAVFGSDQYSVLSYTNNQDKRIYERLYAIEYTCDRAFDKTDKGEYWCQQDEKWTPVDTIRNFLMNKPNPWQKWSTHNGNFSIDWISNWILYHLCSYDNTQYYFGGNTAEDKEDGKWVDEFDDWFGKKGLPARFLTRLSHYRDYQGKELQDYYRDKFGVDGSIHECNNYGVHKDEAQNDICDVDYTETIEQMVVSGPLPHQTEEEHGTGNEILGDNHPRKDESTN